jgi:hypothetical protein
LKKEKYEEEIQKHKDLIERKKFEGIEKPRSQKILVKEPPFEVTTNQGLFPASLRGAKRRGNLADRIRNARLPRCARNDVFRRSTPQKIA